MLKRMTSQQDKLLEELVGLGMMTPEEADNVWWQNREEQERATAREELEELVQAGELSQEDADLHLEETMWIRMARPPHAPSHHSIDHKEVYSRLKEMMEQDRLNREEANTRQESPAGRRNPRQEVADSGLQQPIALRWRKS